MLRDRLLAGLAARRGVDFLDDARGDIQASAAAYGLTEMRVDRPRAAQTGRGGTPNVVIAVAVADTYVHGARMG